MAKPAAKPALPADLAERSQLLARALASGDYARVTAELDEKSAELLDAEKLEAAWKVATAPFGSFRDVVEARRHREADHDVVVVTCELERGRVDLKLVYDASRRIAGLWLSPAWSPPSYAEPTHFTETELTVGEKPWQLPATLTLPTGSGPFPAIVLVHGSGPHDRDESIGPNKPFKDLAWGLASRGIAVLRYEKRTRVHLDAIRNLKTPFTANDETVDDALAAAALLRNTQGIDPARVFMLGHSMGGELLPRIGARDAKLAGLVALAAAATPTPDAIVAQFRYIFELDGKLDDEEKKKLADLEEQAKKVRALTDKDLAGPSIFGAPPSYWLDKRGYDPAAAAKKLGHRMLFLQGGRDYQVTTKDFDRFKKALTAKKNARFVLYEKLNHLFIAGEGKITPAEYQKPGHVDARVIEDVSIFVLSPAPM